MKPRKPKQLKTKHMHVVIYNDGYIGIAQLHKGTPMSAVAFNAVDDLDKLAKWLTKVSAYLKGKKR